jgi:hypothetical protein
MGKKAKTPDAPDPYAVSAAQTASNLATARSQAALNRIDQIGPYGSSVYKDLGNDHYAQEIKLDPRLQNTLDKQLAVQGSLYGLANDQTGRVAQSLQQPFSLSGIPYAPGSYDFSADRNKVEQDLVGRESKYLDQRFKTDEDALRQNLSDRGIGLGNPLYNQELQKFRQSRSDAYGDVQSRAIQAGGSEQSRLYGLAQNSRNSAINELLLQRNQPLQELSSLLQGGGNLQIPQFQTTPGTAVQPTDISSNIYNSYNGQLNAANAKNQQRAQLLGGIGQLGGSILGGFTGGLF